MAGEAGVESSTIIAIIDGHTAESAVTIQQIVSYLTGTADRTRIAFSTPRNDIRTHNAAEH